MPRRRHRDTDHPKQIYESVIVLLSEMPTGTSPCALVKGSILFYNTFITLTPIRKILSEYAPTANTKACRPRSHSTARCSLVRSEEHTSELQSRGHLVCRLLLEKKKTHERTSATS